MQASIRQKLFHAQRRIARQLRPRQWKNQPQLMFAAQNIHYEIAGRTQGLACGGIGAMHLLARRIGLIETIERHLHQSRSDRSWADTQTHAGLRPLLRRRPSGPRPVERSRRRGILNYCEEHLGED